MNDIDEIKHCRLCFSCDGEFVHIFQTTTISLNISKTLEQHFPFKVIKNRNFLKKKCFLR